MKLFWSTRSPFARKVTLLAHELGLSDRIDLVATVVSTMQPDVALTRINPLGQIPTLLLDDGSVIHDSLVICEYLNSLVSGPGLFPIGQPARSAALSRHALGQGMIETLVKLFGERKRDGDPLQPGYVKAYLEKFRRAAKALESDCDRRIGTPVDIGDIAVACALAYADFRFADEDWRSGRPQLAAWHARFSLRPSMVATQFFAPTT